MTLSTPIRIVIVDDDPSVLMDTQLQVKTIAHCLVIATCKSVDEALTVIPATQADILLLDIHLGNENAFDLLERLGDISMKVIFLTAHEEHAIRAIKIGALDYLLKPVNPTQLSDALTKAATALAAQSGQFEIARQHLQHEEVDRIVIHSSQYLEYILVSEIMYCEGNTGYTTFYLVDNKKIVSSKYLKEYELLLPKVNFIRVHQSYLVNTQFIKKYHKEGWLVLTNGTEVPVSVRKREYVKKYLARKQ